MNSAHSLEDSYYKQYGNQTDESILTADVGNYGRQVAYYAGPEYGSFAKDDFNDDAQCNQTYAELSNELYPILNLRDYFLHDFLCFEFRRQGSPESASRNHSETTTILDNTTPR
ncbi:MAG TPA: hypothetical protein DCX67_10290 [Opitutae bacterium]|nr:hypothetical protein [Opitutae bacterium]